MKTGSKEYSEKQKFKQALEERRELFTPEQLQNIIDNEFFNDDTEMDAALIDAAAQQLAALQGIPLEEQYRYTAHQALQKWLQNTKKPQMISNDHLRLRD